MKTAKARKGYYGIAPCEVRVCKGCTRISTGDNYEHAQTLFPTDIVVEIYTVEHGMMGVDIHELVDAWVKQHSVTEAI